MLPEHPRELLLQEAQLLARPLIADVAHCTALATVGQAFTVLVDERVVACGGLVELHANVAEAWGLVGADAGPYLLFMTRAVRRVFAACGYRRVQTVVARDHHAGHRWARLLGLRFEGVLRAYFPDGSDGALYARVQ